MFGSKYLFLVSRYRCSGTTLASSEVSEAAPLVHVPPDSGGSRAKKDVRASMMWHNGLSQNWMFSTTLVQAGIFTTRLATYDGYHY